MTDTRTNAELDAEVIALDRRKSNPATIIADAYAFLGRFVAYPSEHAHVAHTLWIAHTHIMEAWDSTPRAAFLSPEPGSGKTRALEITELLVPRPVEAVNVSPAYLFRKVGDPDGSPTVLFDEIGSARRRATTRNSGPAECRAPAGRRRRPVRRAGQDHRD